MAETNDYINSLEEALKARKNWLETSELGKLKNELRSFQAAFSSLYAMYLNKRLINEDPYKQEANISEIQIPDTGPFVEVDRKDEISQRLSDFDNQIDYLVNFYQYSVDFLNLERIRRILGLIKFIDWVNLSPDSKQPNTRVAAEMTNQIKAGVDAMALRIIGESQTRLAKGTGSIMGCLKSLTDYHKENYKLALRKEVLAQMSPQEAGKIVSVKKKFTQLNPGEPFYAELAEAVIREDYGPEGASLREKVLKSLAVQESPSKGAKPQNSLKGVLLEGFQVLGSGSSTLAEISSRIEENKNLLDKQKIGFIERIKKFLARMSKREPEAEIYELEYTDQTTGARIREKLDIAAFQEELERKVRTLSGFLTRGPGMTKLEAMEEEQILQFLERNIREIQSFHKILFALDDYFKSQVGRDDRERVKGIKPELTTLKNTLVRANQKRFEYSAQQEEEEQLRRLEMKGG